MVDIKLKYANSNITITVVKNATTAAAATSNNITPWN